MIFRQATTKDLKAIMAIIKEARTSLKEDGVPQWQDGYPNKEIIQSDIENGYSFVLEFDKEVIATVAFLPHHDHQYDNPVEGAWKSDSNHGCIHRVAISRAKRASNVSHILMECLVKEAQSLGLSAIRVDTHRDNVRMQKYLRKEYFQYIGIIKLDNGELRDGFERIFD